MITLKSIPHKSHRYPTVGDWIQDEFGNIHVQVSQVGDVRMEFLIMLHELVEAVLCIERGIPEPEMADFDRNFEALRELGQVTGEPGDDPEAPYRTEHRFAENIERLMAQALGVSWSDYEATLERLD